MNYDRAPLRDLQAWAVQTHPEHTDEAARAYVERLIDLEGERRMIEFDFRPGWPSRSNLPAKGDDSRGTATADPMIVALKKGWRDSYWHTEAKRLVNKLPQRKLVAVMIQWGKQDPRAEGPFAASYDQIAASLGHYARMLGWGAVSPVSTHTLSCYEEREVPREVLGRNESEAVKRTKLYATEHKVPTFRKGQSIKRAACGAKAELLLLVKAGV